MISNADKEKITGHSLNGRKFTRKPVNTERMAIDINIPVIRIKTFLASLVPVSVYVITTISIPKKIKVKPSTSHSIVIMSLLSGEISPKFSIVPAVGIKWPIPHKRVSIPDV